MSKKKFMIYCTCIVCAMFCCIIASVTAEAAQITDQSGRKGKLFFGMAKVKQAYLGNMKVYSAGANVTYVSEGKTETVELEDGTNAIGAVTPGTKSGWTFVGWRTDQKNESTVLSTSLVGDTPYTLYAVYRKPITVMVTGGSGGGTKYAYCNAANSSVVSYPTFTLSQTAVSGWNSDGFGTGTGANVGIQYANGSKITPTGNINLYARYSKNITLTTVADGVYSTYQGTAYSNAAGNRVNPVFSVDNPSMADRNFLGWSATAGNTTVTHSSIQGLSLAENATLYAVSQYPDFNRNDSRSSSLECGIIDFKKYSLGVVSGDGYDFELRTELWDAKGGIHRQIFNYPGSYKINVEELAATVNDYTGVTGEFHVTIRYLSMATQGFLEIELTGKTVVG